MTGDARRDESEGGSLHENWKDVSDETGFEYHWHHEEPDDGYLSIRLADENSGLGLGGYGEGWSVELYPDPDNDGRMSRWHFSPDEHDSPEKAAKEFVEGLMEAHA